MFRWICWNDLNLKKESLQMWSKNSTLECCNYIPTCCKTWNILATRTINNLNCWECINKKKSFLWHEKNWKLYEIITSDCSWLYDRWKLPIKLSVRIIVCITLLWSALLNTSRSHHLLHGVFTSQCSSHYNNIRAGCFLCPRFGCVGVKSLQGDLSRREKCKLITKFLTHIMMPPVQQEH